MKEGTFIKGRSVHGDNVEGNVILVYTDAVASGTKDYAAITMLMVRDADNTIHEVRPRDIYQATDGNESPKITLEEEAAMWTSIFNDGYYMSDDAESRAMRVMQKFKIERR